MLLGAAVLAGAAGCDAFAPRTPEAPVAEGSGFRQPDTPEAVVDNLVLAFSARDAAAFRRSLADGFGFTPTPAAAARYPIWGAWDRTAEEAWARGLFAAAPAAAAFSLRLDTRTPADVSDRRYVLVTRYTFSAPHVRPDAPTLVQGRLRWTIERGPDGLWRLAAWTDEPAEGGAAATWSDLKAAFVD